MTATHERAHVQRLIGRYELRAAQGKPDLRMLARLRGRQLELDAQLPLAPAVDTEALLACARTAWPEVGWSIVDDRDGLALQASDTARHVRIIRYVREDPAELVVEAARGLVRQAKPMGGRW